MNLITCSHKCVHQRDGYCRLPSLTIVGNAGAADCIHFTSAEKPPLVKQPPDFSDVFDGKQL